MASSDDEVEAVPSTVSNYEFVDDKDEPVSFAELKFQWNETESLDGKRRHVFLRGTADNGLQKIYKQVTSWKFDFSRIEPAVSVLSKENGWIRLEKPRKVFQDTIRSILITVHSLHFLKKNPESSGRALWDHLSKVFSVYEPRPSENDLVDHMKFINEIVKRDRKLAQSKVREEIKAFVEKKNSVRTQMNYEASVNLIDEDDDMDEVDEMGPPPPKRHSQSSGSSTARSLPKGPITLYYSAKQKERGKCEEDSGKDVKKTLRDRAVSAFASWMYDAGLPFNCVDYKTFDKFIEAVGQYGPGMKPPSYHEVRVTHLKKEVKKVDQIIEEHKVEWTKFGCSIMMDKWTAGNGKMIINVLVNSPRGSVFLESHDASNSSTDGSKMYNLFRNDKIGKENVVQVVTDNASENVSAGKMMEAIYPNIYWTPCAAHCINLMFGDIFKENPYASVFAKAVKTYAYISQRPLLLNLMRKFTQERNLVRPAKTRFATAFLTLHSFYLQKGNLRKLVLSNDWKDNKYAKEAAGREVAKILIAPSFWNDVVRALKVGGPLIRVLRMVDGEKKPPMGYLYEAMDRAKESIAASFNGDVRKYEKVFEIIDSRWDKQLHRPLHAAGHLLNPGLFYKNTTHETLAPEVWVGYHACLEKLIPNSATIDQIGEEFGKYEQADGLFGLPAAMRARDKRSPVEWWKQFGSQTPNLQKFAIKVLSLTCSASGCERNWSVFEHVLLTFLEEKPKKKKLFDEIGSISEFIVDEIIDDNEEEEEEEDDGYNHFESLCAICDDGGELLCCDGKCLRSFHATVEDGAQSQCESLGFTKAQVRAMKYQDFYCKNCEYQRHQCYACGELGSSDLSSHAEVFRCVNATCGHFYHPDCVARLLHPDAQLKVDELRKKIAAGEPFACPLHQCCVCKQREDKDRTELQFAMCRRCPTSYHRKCLPKEIVFDKSKDEEENDKDKDEDEDEEMPRAWDGLIPDRILIYCLKHEIDEEFATPSRDHIKFPGDRRRGKQISEELDKLKGKSAEVSNGRVIAKKPKTDEKLSKAVKFDFSRKRERRLSIPDSSKRQKVIDATRKSLNKTSSAKLHKTVNSEGKASLGLKLYELISRESQPVESSEEGKTKIMKSDKNETSSSQTLDATAKSRILSIMKDVKSSITMDKLVKQISPTTHAYSSKFDKSITLGKVEGSIEAIRAALQILDEGGKVEDAKAVCEPGLLDQIMKWRSKLRVYLAPFLHGMRYTSFGRHFTKVEKLREIADMLHWYVREGDMIVDFCCGSNDFSCLMKNKLDEMGKDCSYKNYDLFKPKNDFNFEKRDWMKVGPDELPAGSKLIMGLNPPFGVNAALANKFIDKALRFKPKLLVLIVPKETERLDVKKGYPYDLIWEDDVLLSGKSFYLPGSVDANNKQMEDWNVSAPPLYLWSRPDWTAGHKAIAQQYGHPSKMQDKLKESCCHTPVPRSVEHGDDVESTRIGDYIDFEDKKRHQHQEYRERSQNNIGKEGGDNLGHAKNRSVEKSMKGNLDKNKFDKKLMKESQDKSKYQKDLDEKSRQDKSKAKRPRDLVEKSTEEIYIGKRSLSRHSSPSVTNHKSSDQHAVSSCKAEEKEFYERFAGQSASALQTEQETGYGVHQDSDMEGRHSLLKEEPYSSLTRHYPQSASPGTEYVGHGAHPDGDMSRRNSLPMQDPYSSLNHQYSQSASPGPEYAFRASDEQFVGYPRERADMPGYRPYPSRMNGGVYARELDVRPQANLYGQLGNEFSSPRSNYTAGASTGYPPYGRLSPSTEPTYGRINTPAMPQYAPHDDLYPGRMNSVGSEGRSGIYGGGVARPGFPGSSSGFAPRPYYPFSQQNSSGWLNE